MVNLHDEIVKIMTREMGTLGKFIVKKQCSENGIDPDNIRKEDLPVLANALYKVMLTFGGPEKAEKVKKEILALRNA